MEELGIDISGQQPKLISGELVDAADAVFIMGCDARSVCPAAFLERAIDWELEDPMGQGVDKYREVRDLIRKHIVDLLRKEGIAPVPLA
jgi:arsenate reductase